LLGARVGYRSKSGAGTAGKNQALHVRLSSSLTP
jgi:hypothetical protein